jgi:hypothetical protein
MAAQNSEILLLLAIVFLGGVYLFKDSLQPKSKTGLLNGNSLAAAKLNGSVGGSDLLGGRNFVEIMKKAVSTTLQYGDVPSRWRVTLVCSAELAA